MGSKYQPENECTMGNYQWQTGLYYTCSYNFVACKYIYMWQAHLETPNYSGSEILYRKSAKIVGIFPFVTRKLLVQSRWKMATLCTEVCSCCQRWNRWKSPSFGKVMGENSLTIEYNARKWVSEYLSTAALPTLETLTGHVSCTTASLAQARLLSTLILMYL